MPEFLCDCDPNKLLLFVCVCVCEVKSLWCLTPAIRVEKRRFMRVCLYYLFSGRTVDGEVDLRKLVYCIL